MGPFAFMDLFGITIILLAIAYNMPQYIYAKVHGITPQNTTNGGTDEEGNEVAGIYPIAAKNRDAGVSASDFLLNK